MSEELSFDAKVEKHVMLYTLFGSLVHPAHMAKVGEGLTLDQQTNLHDLIESLGIDELATSPIDQLVFPKGSRTPKIISSLRTSLQDDLRFMGRTRYEQQSFDTCALNSDSEAERIERANILSVMSGETNAIQRIEVARYIGNFLGKSMNGGSVDTRQYALLVAGEPADPGDVIIDPSRPIFTIFKRALPDTKLTFQYDSPVVDQIGNEREIFDLHLGTFCATVASAKD